MLIGIDAHSLEGKRTGVGRVLFNIIRQWEKASAADTKFILYFKDRIPTDLPQRHFFEARLFKSSSTAKFIHWNLWRAAKKDKLDILFCPEYIAPILYRGRMAVLLHDISYEVHPEWFNWKSPADRILLKWVSKKISRRADIIFTPLEFVKNEIIKYYGISPEKIIVIGEGVDPVFLSQPEEDGKEVLEKYGIKDKFIFYIGSIFSRRHLPEILKAFLKIAQDRADLQLLMSGVDYTASKSVDKMAEEINRNLKRDAVLRQNFIGDRDLSQLYRKCELVVWISDYEGFGLPVAEGMACGAPVITTDGTSLKEVAGQAAYLIKDNANIEEIYQGMKKILEDGVLRQNLIEKSREQAKKFNWKSCAEIILERFLSVR